jgi:uncharacterized protein
MTELDCQKCGACCVAEWQIPVEHGDDVPKRYTRSTRNVIGFASWEAEDGIRRMHKIGDRCAALKGKVGNCSCKIYARRPQACIDFEPGNSRCLDLREGLENGQTS